MQINVAIFMLMLRFCCSEQRKNTKQNKPKTTTAFAVFAPLNMTLKQDLSSFFLPINFRAINRDFGTR